jgi:hypothetical protein
MQQEINKLERIPNIKIKLAERLHAKLYLNETNAVLTSLNYYEQSQDKNDEIGIHFYNNRRNSDERKLFTKTVEYADKLINGASEI